MKLKSLLILFVPLFLFSCVKQEIDPQNLDIDKITVPNEFNWRTDQTIELQIIQEEAGLILVTSESGEKLYHKGFHSTEDDYHIKLTLPAYEKTILVNSRSFNISSKNIVCDLRANTSLKSFKSDLSGQLMWWSFNKTEGTKSQDKISGVEAKIIEGNFVPAETKEGVALDGSTSYIDLDDAKEQLSSALKNSSSISFWARIDKVGEPNSAHIVHLRDKDANKELRIEYSSSNQVRFIYNNWEARILLTQNMSGVTAGDGVWHHYVMAWNTNDKSLNAFIDGEVAGEFSGIPEWQPKLSSALIGKRSDDLNGGQHMGGIIDEFIVWNHPLSLEEAQQIFASADYSLNYFGFNENQGSQVIDEANQYVGQIHGAKWDKGVLGSCLNFNGTSDWVEVENSNEIDLQGAITMMAWVKVEEYGTYRILQKGDWDGSGIGITNWPGFQARIQTIDKESHSIEWEGGRPLLNTWYHVAMTYNGKKLILYVNGEEAGSNSINLPLSTNSRAISIGSDAGSQKFFAGSIDEAKIVSKCLSESEIKTYYKNLPNSDSDGDGVEDSDDDYPENAALAFENQYPAGQNGSLAFEDLWPGKGDFDFNDLVLDYNFNIISDAQNHISKIVGSFEVRAIGASFKNGFGFQLMGNNLNGEYFKSKGSVLSENYIELNNNGLEEGQERPTFIVFDNAFNVLHSSGGSGVNTDPTTSPVDPVIIKIEIEVTQGKYTLEDLAIEEFNPFIIVEGDRGREVHLPDHKPTSKANTSLLGTSHDYSDEGSGQYYKTQNNLPWALNIAGHFDYPIEKTKISKAFLFFTSWASSTGQSYTDWYLDKNGYRDINSVY